MKFILIIISLLPLKILAQDLALECDKNGVLTNITSASNPELCLSTEVLNENGKDLVNVAKKLNSNTISLKTPYRSLVTNKNSNSYDRDSIEETIAWALEAGVDPFAALSVVILENPPLAKKSKEDNKIAYMMSYESLYGSIPLDNIALMDTMGCQISSNSQDFFTKKYGPEKFDPFFSEQKKFTQLTKRWDNLSKSPLVQNFLQTKVALRDLKVDTPEALIKKSELTNKIASLAKNPLIMEYITLEKDVTQTQVKMDAFIERASLTKEEQDLLNCTKDGKNFCRGSVTGQKSVPAFNFSKSSNAKEELHCVNTSYLQVGGGLNFGKKAEGNCCAKVKVDSSMDGVKVDALLKKRLALDFFKQQIQNRVSSKEGLALALQRYNGIGCFGCTETKDKYEGNCMSQIVMADRPVYGVKAADIMVNMLMNNPEILAMIQKAKLKTKTKSVVSLFCLENGPGKIAMDDQKYINLQKDYLLRGAEGDYGLAFKTGNSFRIRKPASDADREIYQQVEKKRAEICAKHFN